MKILKINATNGPNYWSIRRHKLIIMRLDLEELEQFPTNKIDGFLQRLEKMFPTMYEHRCSEGVPGGFFLRVEQGTWMGHVIEHIALEIQSQAGMEVGFGRTRSTSEAGVYNVVFAYMEEKAGRYAAEAAVRISKSLVDNTFESYDLENDLLIMRELREDERLGPSTGSIVEEAVSRGIPYIRLNHRSLVQLGFGINQKRIQATVASTTSNIAVEIACDKEETKNLLDSMQIPVPKGLTVRSEAGLRDAVAKLGYPLVLKPIDGNHGKGATIGVKDWNSAVEALAKAKERSRSVMVERFIVGHDYRLLVIDYKFVAAAKRTPAAVIGDGVHTIQELIDIVNSDVRRGFGHEKVLTKITVDDTTEKILEKNGYTLATIIAKDEELHLKATANLSTGGTSEDVTDIVHPYNVFMAERIARIIGLDICGIDVMSPDISVPLHENRGAVLEVNAAPGFRMHLDPTQGLARNVAAPVVDMLFPLGSSARIPIIGVTGTNGKTTTTRLIAHIVKTMGHKVGFTTSDGIYIQNRILDVGDCTGPKSAEFVLRDPTVDFAVLECARGGILRAGLGFANCDIAICTNIAPDHLGLSDIDSLEQLARVKSVVLETVFPHGYAIMNADDDLVYAMRENVQCNTAYFSLDEHNPRIKQHTAQGGIAAVAENGFITICKGNWKLRVEKIINVPLSFSGKASFNVQNILAATLAGFLRGFKLEDLRVALTTFVPSPAQTPGRMNIFKFKNFDVMIDYAHNAHGLNALGKFIEQVEASVKIGVIAGVGDRRDEDTKELGSVAAKYFDQIIIRQDKNLRGRTEQAIIDLLLEGIKAVDPNKEIMIFRKENEAIDYVVKHAPKDAFITICSDVVPDALDQIMKLKEIETNLIL